MLVLLPEPRSLKLFNGSLTLKGGSRIVCQGDPTAVFPIADTLKQDVWEYARQEWHLWAGNADDDEKCQAVLTLSPESDIPSQGYRLSIDPTGIQIEASERSGLFYGVMTLRQILRQCRSELPVCEINDHPDYPIRGLMLDVSRDKVPTLDTLFMLCNELAELKINHIELYTEHAFAYRNHQEAWAQASPITGDDVLRLDAFCRERFIELVPNQNSFGHMERWLKLPRYNKLAECPDGSDIPGIGPRDPYSFDPTNPESLRLIDELHSELLPHFTSRKFNVGCDETFDLGHGKSKEECERKGKGRVYLEFLLKIRELVNRHSRTMLFWGDIINDHPELVPELPKDVVVLEWGYEANHPFDENCARFAQSGLEFYVCPGTSSWCSIAGRTDNCIGNLRNAAENGLKHDATGFLNTDWGDYGHWQYLPVSYLGYAAGAALSWCYEANRDKDFVRELDVHVFRDEAGIMGRLAYDLGNAYRQLGFEMHNGSVLFRMLVPRTRRLVPDSVTEADFRKAEEYIKSVILPLHGARMARPDASVIQDEFDNTARLMLFACRLSIADRTGALESDETRRSLESDLSIILGEHRRLWTVRNRPGGLQDSTAKMQDALKV